MSPLLRVGVSQENGLYQEDKAYLTIMELLSVNYETASLTRPNSSLLSVSTAVLLTGFEGRF